MSFLVLSFKALVFSLVALAASLVSSDTYLDLEPLALERPSLAKPLRCFSLSVMLKAFSRSASCLGVSLAVAIASLALSISLTTLSAKPEKYSFLSTKRS